MKNRDMIWGLLTLQTLMDLAVAQWHKWLAGVGRSEIDHPH